MARQLGSIKITLRADESGNLLMSGHEIRYVTCESSDTALGEAGREPLDAITGTDTIDDWWAKVQAQIKTKHGIS